MTEPRSPDILDKPQANKLFNKNIKKFEQHFVPVKDFLLKCYTGDNHGFVDFKSILEYRFNNRRSGGYIIITARNSYSIVSYRDFDGRDKHKIFPKIKSSSDLDELKKFFKANKIPNFKKLSDNPILPPLNSNDEKEQIELEQLYKHKTKDDIRNELENSKNTDSEEIIVNHKTYKRDNRTIALIKILRDFKCQICSTAILKKDGSHYVEAAHIKPKCQKGRETPDNIILLCPNHHKEFDYGHLEIKLHDTEQIDFVLNGQQHRLKLSIE